MSQPISWGILGTGEVARLFADGLRCSSTDAQLLAVGSRTQSRADAFATQFGVPGLAFGSYEELTAEPSIDVVYVATPNHRHSDDCILCLEAGKAVLCEKPFSLNAQGARQVIEVACEKRIFCMEAMWMRFMPLIQKARTLVTSGMIGDVRLLTADFGVQTQLDEDNRLFSPELGGGALLDRGVYGLSLAFHLLGPPCQVTGHATMCKTGVDEQSAIVLGFPEGQMAILSAALRIQTSNEASIIGTKGMIRLHAPFFRPQELSITLRPESNSGKRFQGRFKPYLAKAPWLQRLYRRYGALLSPFIRKPNKRIAEPIVGNGYNYEADEVTRCLQRGQLESKLMPLDESLQIMNTMDTIRGQWNLKYPQEREAS